MRNYFFGAALVLAASSAFADSSFVSVDNQLPLEAVTLESNQLPFLESASVFRLGLYQQIPLDKLISSGMIGSNHDLKVSLHSDSVVVEVPGHRIRYNTLLGYDPKSDSRIPYQEVYDPDIRYHIREGDFHLRGKGLGKCGDVSSIFSSGSYIYLEMPEGGEGVECAIDALLMSYGLFDFHAKDRPEMYQVVESNSDKPDEILNNKAGAPRFSF